MAEMSLEEAFGPAGGGATPTPAPAKAATPAPTAKKVMTLEEAFGKHVPKKTTTQASVAEAIKLTDTVLSVGNMAVAAGLTGVADIAAVWDGNPEPMKAANEVVARIQQTPFMKFLAAPVQNIMKEVAKSPLAVKDGEKKLDDLLSSTYTEEAGNWVMKQIDSLADYATKKTGNPEMGEGVKQAANIAMLGGVHAVGHVVKYAHKMSMKQAGSVHTPPVEPGKEVAPQSYTHGDQQAEVRPEPEPTHGTLFGQDAQINAEKIAHGLVNRGASLKEVLAARKRNPLVGDAIDAIMKQREMFRTGDTAKGVEQGDVLPPEGKGGGEPPAGGGGEPRDGRAAMARGLPDPHEYAQAVKEAMAARVKQLEDKTNQAIPENWKEKETPPPQDVKRLPPPKQAGPSLTPAGKPDLAYHQFKTVGEALDHLKKTGTEFEQALVDAIHPAIKDLKFKTVQPGQVGAADMQGSHGYYRPVKMGLFRDWGKNGVFVAGEQWGSRAKGLTHETVLHESLHAALAEKINTGAKDYNNGVQSKLAELVKELHEFHRYVKDYADAMRMNGSAPKAIHWNLKAGTKDMHELISHGLTKPEFQAWLKTIPGKINKTAWGDLTDKLRRLLGMDAKHQSALADLLDITERLNEAKFDYATEVSSAKSYSRMNKEAGQVEIKYLARIAAAGVGATIGASLSDKADKISGAIFGALGAITLTMLRPSQAIDVVNKITKRDDRATLGNLGDNHEIGIKSAEVVNFITRKKIDERVPDKKRQAAITHWIEGDKSIQLSPDELAVAKEAKAYFDKLGREQMALGTMKGFRENYVTHIWEWGMQGKSALQRALDKKGAMAGMSPKSQFAKERTIATIKEGKELGLTPKTESIGEIMEIYGNAAARAMANKRLLDGLRAAKTLDGVELALPADKAPHTYVSINHPQLNGLRIHPDLAPSLEFLFDARTPSAAGRALDAFNTGMKRMAVSFSLFHNKALTDAFIGASSKPWRLAHDLAGFISGKDAFLKQLNEEGLTPMVQRALKGGLTFTLDKGTSVDEDVGGAFYGAMKDLQGFADQVIPHAGKPIEGLIKINHAVDTLTWARMHTGMKLKIFTEKLEQLELNNARAHEANPEKVALFKEGEAEKIAASYTNDIFGGLNWRRVAEGMKREWVRDLALGALKPSSRRMMQLMLFAPDWTISTVRAVTQAAGKGTGVKGLLHAQTLADLHRQYILRSAVYYLTVGDAINYAMSGHHIWDPQQKDKTRIDLGDGRTMQWSKHTMESVDWLKDPAQQALNKLGALPKQAIEQMTHKEYLSAHGHAPEMKGSRLEHLAKGLSPISVQQNFNAGTSAGVAGFLGAPIYGKTTTQKFKEKLSKKMEAHSPEKNAERERKKLKKLEGQ